MATAVDGLTRAGAGQRLRPPQVVLLLAGLALAVHGLAFGLAAPLGSAPLAGGGLLAAGLGWMGWAAWLLRRAGTPIRPSAQPLVLIEEGPYRVGRNPMLLGLVVALLGAALALGVPLLVGATLALVVLAQRVHIPQEEARLRQHFGGWYSDYTARVRRWV